MVKRQATGVMTEKIQRLPLCSDYVFKRVFSKEGNENLLKDFLEAILEIEIESVEIQNPELPKNTKEEKLGVLDIKAKVNENYIVDIEMQVTNEYNIAERSTTYLGKLISNQLTRGDSYNKLKKSIVINILNFNYYKRNSYHMVAHMKFEKTNEKTYVDLGYCEEEELATNQVEMHFIELPKFKKKNPEAKEKIEQWLWLFSGEEEKIKMAEKENKEIKKAVRILDEMSMNKEEYERYEALLKAEFNYNTSINNVKEIGIKEGEKSKQREIAKKMITKGMDVEQIYEITGLDRNEIEKLKNERKK